MPNTTICNFSIFLYFKMATTEDVDPAESFLNDYEILGDYIPLQKHLDLESDMEVFVTEIRTPYKFWLQLKVRSTDRSKLFDDMQAFYGMQNRGAVNYPLQLSIPPQYIMRNQICAAIYKEDQVLLHIVFNPRTHTTPFHFI